MSESSRKGCPDTEERIEVFVEAKNVVVNTLSGNVMPEERNTGEAPNLAERFRLPSWGSKVVTARAGSADLCGQVPVFIPTRVGFKYDRLHVTPRTRVDLGT